MHCGNCQGGPICGECEQKRWVLALRELGFHAHPGVSVKENLFDFAKQCRDALLQNQECVEVLERARTYTGLEAAGCPLCTYVEGKFVAACSFHRKIEDLELQVDEIFRLHRETKRNHGTCQPRSERSCTACNAKDDLQVLLERGSEKPKCEHDMTTDCKGASYCRKCFGGSEKPLCEKPVNTFGLVHPCGSNLPCDKHGSSVRATILPPKVRDFPEAVDDAEKQKDDACPACLGKKRFQVVFESEIRMADCAMCRGKGKVGRKHWRIR